VEKASFRFKNLLTNLPNTEKSELKTSRTNETGSQVATFLVPDCKI
jgi:hypothetical protein